MSHPAYLTTGVPKALDNHDVEGFDSLGANVPLGLVDLDAVAATSDIPRATLRTWQRRGKITPAACDVRSRRLLFDLAQLDDHATTRRR